MMVDIACLSRYLLLVVLNVEHMLHPMDATTTVIPDTAAGKSPAATRPGDLGLSGKVSWWAESLSLALNDLATRTLGHDQLQQLYDNSVCMTSLAPDDVNMSEHVLAAAATFSQSAYLTLPSRNVESSS